MTDYQPKHKNIGIRETPCLVGKRGVVKVSIIQPRDELICDNTLGPHYSDDRIGFASKRVFDYLHTVKLEKVDLCIAPEFFTPLKSANALLDNLNHIRSGTLYILPLESIKNSDFDKLFQDYGSKLGQDNVVRTRLRSNSNKNKSINCCMIICRNKKEIRVFFQSKILSAPLETDLLNNGCEILSFFSNNVPNNESLSIAVAICSDANMQPPFKAWSALLKEHTGSYIVHTQFNPSPNYENYYTDFYSTILNTHSGENRLILSANWAPGSRLRNTLDSSIIELDIPSTRIIRGKLLHKGSHYKHLSLCGLFLQKKNFTESVHRTWEIWHLLATNENVVILDIIRPSEAIEPATEHRNYGIFRSTYYSYNGSFSKGLPDDLTKDFFDHLRKKNVVVESLPSLDGVSICELELFVNTMLLRERGTWIEGEIYARIPTSVYFCLSRKCSKCVHIYSECKSKRAEVEKLIDYITQCLRTYIEKNDVFKDFTFLVPDTAEYPLNLVKSDKSFGWLFHCQSLTKEVVAKIIYSSIKDLDINSFRIIYLFPKSVTGKLTKEDIFSNTRDIANPDSMSNKCDDIEHFPELYVTQL